MDRERALEIQCAALSAENTVLHARVAQYANQVAFLERLLGSTTPVVSFGQPVTPSAKRSDPVPAPDESPHPVGVRVREDKTTESPFTPRAACASPPAAVVGLVGLAELAAVAMVDFPVQSPTPLAAPSDAEALPESNGLETSPPSALPPRKRRLVSNDSSDSDSDSETESGDSVPLSKFLVPATEGTVKAPYALWPFFVQPDADTDRKAAVAAIPNLKDWLSDKSGWNEYSLEADVRIPLVHTQPDGKLAVPATTRQCQTAVVLSVERFIGYGGPSHSVSTPKSLRWVEVITASPAGKGGKIHRQVVMSIKDAYRLYTGNIKTGAWPVICDKELPGGFHAVRFMDFAGLEHAKDTRHVWIYSSGAYRKLSSS
jgi:hypothetical protein